MTTTCLTNIQCPDVLMVSHTGHLGGAERSLLALAEALTQNGTYHPVLACPEAGGLGDAMQRAGVDGTTLSASVFERLGTQSERYRLPYSVLRGTSELSGVVRRRRPCLVHANGIKACLPALLCALISGIPCVWHVRDYPRHPSLIGMLLRCADAVIAPSDFIGSALASLSAPARAKIRVIPNGVARISCEPEDANAFRRSIATSPNALLVSMVAQFAPWKRHDLFLEAASLVSVQYPEARFLIAGSDIGGLNATYVKRLRLRSLDADLQGRVTFLGEREDIAVVLSASDILVLPSENEPFGRVVVESWWTNTPAVVSDLGGPAELVEDGVTGVHFKTGDGADLARAILLLAERPSLRDSIASAGLSRASDFSVERHCRAVTELYRELAA